MELYELLQQYSVEIIIGLAALIIILFVLYIINIVQMGKMKKRYRIFMEGKNAKTLEDTLIKRLDQIDSLIISNNENEKNIKKLFSNMKYTFQKSGLVKYDAFNELGGKLSFSLALLNESNDGYMLNVVHNKDSCYIYMKEIVKGNSIILLTEEEKKALALAIGESNKEN